MRVKGLPVWVFNDQPADAVSEDAADCTRWYNALSVQVIANGVSPTATLSIIGAPAQGAATYLSLPDPNASKALTGKAAFDVVVGSAYAKAQLSSVSGVFTVIFTPYRSPGPCSINVRVG